MLIPFNYLIQHYKINVTGILHVGAHECEELQDYLRHHVPSDKIFWVEAMQGKVDLMKSRGVPNVYQAIVDDVDDKAVTFNISNNGESSSLLEFGTHLKHHPQIHYVASITGQTKRLDTLIEENNIPITELNFINLDLQGVELRALRSMEKYLSHVKYIYTEVNTDYVYKECTLVTELDDYLRPFGFNRVATRMCRNYGWGDALYVKS